MSNKTTEEASEILHRHLGHATGLWQNAPILAAMEEYKETSIAQLREENERLRKALQQIEQHSDSGSPLNTMINMKRTATEALTPKPPKTNGE